MSWSRFRPALERQKRSHILCQLSLMGFEVVIASTLFQPRTNDFIRDISNSIDSISKRSDKTYGVLTGNKGAD